METNKMLMAAVIGIIIIATLHMTSALTLTNVQVFPDNVQPSGKVSLTLTLENDLSEEIKDVSMRVILGGLTQTSPAGTVIRLSPEVPFSTYQSSDTRTTDRIRTDKTADFGFDLQANPDAVSGVYRIPVAVSYTLNNTRQTIDLGTVSISLNALPSLSTSSESSGVIKNQANDVTIQIINSGLGDAKFLSISIDNVPGARIIGANSFYIGNINKDDFDSVKLNLFVNSNAGSTLSIPVNINYRDSSNKDFSESKIVSVKAYSQQEAVSIGLVKQSNTGLYIGIIVLVIVAYIIYRIIRGILKRRKNREE